MKTMPYNEFVELVNQTAINFDWRYGQSVMNVLHAAWHDKHDEIINTEKDCYYNDKLVSATLSYLEQEWKKD